MRGLDLVQANRSITARRVCLAALVALASACAPLPPRAPGDETAPRYPYQAPAQRPVTPDLASYPRSAEEVSGPPVLNLLAQAQAQIAAGRAEQAVAALETALDIEPRNPFVWQRLADAHLAQHLPDQAENKAQRSNSFARGNPFVEVENWRVIAAARQARGDLSGARMARERMAELQALLGTE